MIDAEGRSPPPVAEVAREPEYVRPRRGGPANPAWATCRYPTGAWNPCLDCADNLDCQCVPLDPVAHMPRVNATCDLIIGSMAS